MVGALAVAAAWWLLDLLVLRAGVPDRLDDTWEYGVVARSLLAGEGFRTSVIHPPLWGLRDAAFTVPVLVHGPLIPLLLAPFLALLGPGALDGIVWLAAFGAFAAVAPLVRLGERCGGGAIGFAAAALWTLSPLTVRSVHHDVSLTIGAALLIAALELITRPPAAGGPHRFAGGIALGLACLTRHELLAALPLFALASGAAGWRMLAGAALCLLPWWVHHALAVGQPLFNLSSYLAVGYWGGWPGISVLRDFSLTPDRFSGVLAASFPEILGKWTSFAPHAIKRALLAPIPALGWLAVLGALFGVLSVPKRRATWMFLAVAMIPIVVMTVTLYDDRYLVPFLPLYALAVASGAHLLAQRLPWWMHHPRAWIGLLLLAALPAAAPALREGASQARRDAEILVAERAALREWTQRAEAGAARPVHSDTPDFVAWTTGRPTLWLTAEENARLPLQPGASGLPARADADRAWFHPPDSGISR
ncbi:MAG: hypothetical protein ABIS67_05295 [Candidatus Eisenbacteria bacterium]